MTRDRLAPARTGLRWLLMIGYGVVGIVHLRSPDAFLPIVPGWVPLPRTTVLVTGACEIAGAVALGMPRLRWLAGVMLATYAVCVYPANIKHAIDGVAVGGVHLGAWYHVPRLAFQPVLVWAALFAGGATSWPWRRGSARIGS
ncbi:MAG: hypothetical protein B7Y45_07880 [Sphingomonas sp. 28-66-16]|nr:MAG: hypothetical protein B7Y45_07880 [Sphingomonas sp. 28-66-16]